MLSSSIVVGWVQITQNLLHHTYMPYSVGLLDAYAKKHTSSLSRYTFLPIIFEREPLHEQVEALRFANVIGFSTYIWNINYSLSLARLIKKARPETLIVFGGPQVPDRAEGFLRAHPFVDVVCHGAGESVMLEILESYPQRNWGEIQSISYLKGRDFIHQPLQERMNRLETIPSPYLQGSFDPLFKHHPHRQWIALWETNRGCPFSCAFCDWGSAVNSKVFRFPMERLNAEMTWFARHHIDMIYCCDANFGLLKRDIDITERMITLAKKNHTPKSFYVQNTKNATERAYHIQKSLYESGLNQMITLSLQSLNPDTLRWIKRDNISLDMYRELQHRFRKEGVETYTDLLIGLPGETYESFVRGVSQVVAEGQHHIVKFYQVYLLPNAEMAHPDYRKTYGIKTVKTPYFFTYEQAQSQEIPEWQEMIVETHTMNRQDLARMRAFAWWCEIVYFNRKLAQIPLVFLMQRTHEPLHVFIEVLLSSNMNQWEILPSIQAFLMNKAEGLTRGEPDHCYGPFAPGIQAHMSVEEYIHTGLINSQAIPLFFKELGQVFEAWTLDWPEGLWQDCLSLSQALFSAQHPKSSGFELDLTYNIWEVYQGVLKGQTLELQSSYPVYTKNWAGPPNTVQRRTSGPPS